MSISQINVCSASGDSISLAFRRSCAATLVREASADESSRFPAAVRRPPPRVGSPASLGTVVQPDSPVRDVADLKGWTVVVSSARGSISQYQLNGRGAGRSRIRTIMRRSMRRSRVCRSTRPPTSRAARRSRSGRSARPTSRRSSRWPIARCATRSCRAVPRRHRVDRGATHRRRLIRERPSLQRDAMPHGARLIGRSGDKRRLR